MWGNVLYFSCNNLSPFFPSKRPRHMGHVCLGLPLGPRFWCSWKSYFNMHGKKTFVCLLKKHFQSTYNRNKQKDQGIVITSTGVAKTNRYWIASTKTPGFVFERPTAQIACSSPLYSAHWPSLLRKNVKRWKKSM